MWKTRLRQPVSRIFSDQVVSFRDPAAADSLTNWSGKNGERAVKSKKRLVLTEHRPPRKKEPLGSLCVGVRLWQVPHFCTTRGSFSPLGQCLPLGYTLRGKRKGNTLYFLLRFRAGRSYVPGTPRSRCKLRGLHQFLHCRFRKTV